MNKLKAIAKTAMGETLLRTGIWERYLTSMARRGAALVLTYHRVIEKWDRTLDYSQPGLVVTADTFHRQLQFLRRYFDIVPLSSLISDFEFRISKCSDFRDAQSANPQSAIRNPQSSLNSPLSTLSRPFCSITFDDGWRDNYEIAFPILQKHGVPATVFLTTDFIGTNRAFWHTELMYLLMHGELSRFKLTQYVLDPYPTPVRLGLMRLAHMEQAPDAHDVDPLIEAVKATCDEPTTDQLIGDVGNALGVRRPLFPDRSFFLDWGQVTEMAGAGIEMGSHGCTHRILTRIKLQDAGNELVRSKAEIERHTGQEVKHFAFPDGAANRDLMAFVEKARYRTACLCRTVPTDERFGTLALQRVGMHEGVSGGGNRSFMESGLGLWLFRAPSMRRG
ncbi:MAG: polysaccharide deacetylase family protein [Candidatus Methylomirabilales bacterium]